MTGWNDLIAGLIVETPLTAVGPVVLRVLAIPALAVPVVSEAELEPHQPEAGSGIIQGCGKSKQAGLCIQEGVGAVVRLGVGVEVVVGFMVIVGLGEAVGGTKVEVNSILTEGEFVWYTPLLSMGKGWPVALLKTIGEFEA